MTNKLMKAGAVASFITGLSLMTLPVLAGGPETCILNTVGGSYHTVSYGCQDQPGEPIGMACAKNGDSCSYARWLKGWYCAEGGNETRCKTLSATPTQVSRRNSTCVWIRLQNPPEECICSDTQATDWYDIPGDTKPRGRCETI